MQVMVIQVRYCRQLNLFQFPEDISRLIQEASSVLTYWRMTDDSETLSSSVSLMALYGHSHTILSLKEFNSLQLPSS